MANIRDCRMGRRGRLFCAYAYVKLNSQGYPQKEYCNVCKSGNQDHYNIFPDIDAQENIINQQKGSIEPISFGPTIIWESDSTHNTGMSIDSHYKDISEIHPLYHVKEINIPSKKNISDDSTADVFGSDNLALVSNLWNSQRVTGIPRVEYCQPGIYGFFNKNSGVIETPDMRDYTTDIKNWINYSTVDFKKWYKEIYIGNTTKEDIIKYSETKLGKGYKTNRVIEFLDFINTTTKKTYFNFRQILENNGFKKLQIDNFMEGISIRTIDSIYSREFNPLKYAYHYKYLETIIKNPIQLKRYKAAILNYVLNCPFLINANPKSEILLPRERFWYLHSFIYKAYTDKIMDVSKYPEWLKDKLKVMNEKPLIDIFEYADAVIEGASLNGKINPPIRKIDSILKIKDTEKVIYDAFKPIIRVGATWSPWELESVWTIFKRAYKRNNPKFFWDFIDYILHHSAAEYEYNHKRPLSLSRIFAYNIDQCMEDERSFNIIEIRKNRWNLINKKLSKRPPENYDSRYNCSYIKLAQMGGLKSDSLLDIHYLASLEIEEIYVENENDHDGGGYDEENDFTEEQGGFIISEHLETLESEDYK